ncbi:MAG: hypothetical protein WD467_00250 [Candidatus Saccharimonadales bacterium]
MIGKPYAVELKTLDDSSCDVVFEIRPPVEFISEEARKAFGRTVLMLINRRADTRDQVLDDGMVEITHDKPNGESTMGYAKIKTLRYGSGKEIFTQALLLALNGDAPDLYADGAVPWE